MKWLKQFDLQHNSKKQQWITSWLVAKKRKAEKANNLCGQCWLETGNPFNSECNHAENEPFAKGKIMTTTEPKKKRGRPRKNPEVAPKKKSASMSSKIGRPRFEITPEVIKRTEQLAAQGLTKEQIARVLGIGVSTLCDKQATYPEFLEALNNGAAKGIAQITNKLFQKASEGDNTAMIFYLKNRDPDNWEDVHKRKLVGADDGDVGIAIKRRIIADDDADL